MVKRYEMTETQWRRIEPLLPDKASDRGRPPVHGCRGASGRPLSCSGNCISCNVATAAGGDAPALRLIQNVRSRSPPVPSS